MRTRTMLPALLLLLAHSAVLAQPRPLAAAELDAMFASEPRIEVNVAGPLLGLVAEMTRGEEPHFSAMVRQLRGVYVRQYALTEARPGLSGRVADVARALERQGWQVMVRVREPQNDVYIYHRPAGEALEGLVVMVLQADKDEATFVTIDGRIDPAHIGRLGRQFNVPALEEAAASRR